LGTLSNRATVSISISARNREKDGSAVLLTDNATHDTGTFLASSPHHSELQPRERETDREADRGLDYVERCCDLEGGHAARDCDVPLLAANVTPGDLIRQVT
jgi:hypothetical protein